jgi:hypothetical protein
VRLRINPEKMTLDNKDIPLADAALYDSAMPAADISGQELKQRVASCRRILTACAPPRSIAAVVLQASPHITMPVDFETQMTLHLHRVVRALEKALWKLCPGLTATDAERITKGAVQLSGCGPGLTPGGDDFVSGMFIALHLLEMLWQCDFSTLCRTVCAACTTENLLSMHFLALARDGRVHKDLKTLLIGLAARTDTGNTEDLSKPVCRMVQIGDTSGADLLAGLLTTLTSAGRKAGIAL